jgi:uncharacterized protein with von Willebrand factor type A (vWA) domain
MDLNQFALQFYYRIRERGLNLSFDEYGLLLHALRCGLGLGEKAQFAETCMLLWGKNESEQILIKTEFNQFFDKQYAWISSDQQKTTQHPPQKDSIKQDKTNTPKDPPPEKNTTSEGKEKDQEKKHQGQKLEEHNAPAIAFYPPEASPRQGNTLEEHLNSQEVDYIHSPFILTDDYLPFSIRKLQQTTRGLRVNVKIGFSETIDWSETIQKVAREMFFTQPVYQWRRKNQLKMIVLIDHLGSMIAHTAIGQQLIKGISKDGGYPSAKIFYTNNIPSEYLYKNERHTQDISVNEMLDLCLPKKTVLLIFSDAGASKGLLDVDRIKATKRFLERVKKKVNSIVWLNPMPRERWANTSAELIKYMAPMFECTEPEIERAIKTLKTGINERFY